MLRWYAEQIQGILRTLLKRDLDIVSIIDDFGDLIYREIDYRFKVTVVFFEELFSKVYVYVSVFLSEQKPSMRNGSRSCIQISPMCLCLRSTRTYQLARFSLWSGTVHTDL